MSRLLKKSFDAAKCKTLLQLSLQRIKVLRNKHFLIAKKLRADIAKVIEKGQDESAKMQVVHIFRAEKNLVVYDLLEQYCQLIINRIQSMKTQKECPLDMKEAVASIIYAASRCGDLEELKKVSKQLTSKYGTEFSVAAKDLRPDCGVNTRVIENLSALPPSVEMTLKLLKDIAAESKIDWDPERASVHVSMGAANVLDGPNHFESATQASSRGSQGVTSMQRPIPIAVNGRVNSISHDGSQNVSPVESRSSLYAERLYGHQSAATTDFSPRVQAYSNDRTEDQSGAGRNLGFSSKLDGARTSPNLDPYAVAKAQGKMDYKVVTDFMKKEQDNEIPSFPRYEEMRTCTRKKDMVGFNKSYGMEASDAAHDEDTRKYTKTRLSVHRPDVESEIHLATAAEAAFVSAAQAAEAAKAAMDMVRKKSLERVAGSKVDGNNRWQHSRSRSGSVWEESHATALSKHCAVNEPADQGKGGILPSMVHEPGSEPRQSSAMKDSLNYVVFDDDSGSGKQPGRYNKGGSLKEMGSQTAQHHSSKGLDGPPLFDVEHEEGSSSDEFDRRATTGRLYASNETIEANPTAKNLKVTVHKTGFVDLMTSVHDKKREDVSSTQLPEVHDVSSVPQFDDYASEQASGGEGEEVGGEEEKEEDDDEEIPFYMKGRAAVYREDLESDARRLSGKMDPKSCVVTQDCAMEQSSSVVENTEPEERNLDFDDSDESEDVVSNQTSSTFFEHPRKVSQQGRQECFERPVYEVSSLPSQSLQTPCRPQIGGGEMEFADGEKTSTSPSTRDASYGKLATPSSTWGSPESPSWPSSLSSVKSSSPQESRAGYEHRDLPQQGKPKLSWASTEVESPLQEIQLKPLSLGEDGRDDIKQETRIGNIEALPGKAYQGMSRRSVRSTRMRRSFAHEDASPGG